jgi:membrane protein
VEVGRLDTTAIAHAFARVRHLHPVGRLTSVIDRNVPQRARPAWEVLRRTVAEVREDRLVLVSAGVAFFALLSIPPILFATLAVYGLVTTKAEVERQLSALSDLLPDDVQALLLEQLGSLVETSPDRLSRGAVIAVLAALWSASTGQKFLIIAVGVAFDVEERRSGLRVRALSLLFALATVLLVGLAILAGAVVPALLPDTGAVRLAAGAAAWLVVALVGAVAASLVYRFGPSRPAVRWRANTWGSGVAVVTWLAASGVYFGYVGSFGSFGETYGALASLVVTMLWALLTAFAILLGAEVDAELGRYRAERRAAQDEGCRAAAASPGAASARR